MGSTWIVIVNYRTAELTINCLRALSTQVADLGGGRVVVVDNDSGDGSVEKLNVAIEREGWSGWASVMPLDRNGGFAYGNNAGFRAALASYVLASRVMHIEGASTSIRATGKRRAKYWYNSRRRFFVKHHGITRLVAADVLWTIGRFSFLLRRCLHLGARNPENNDPKWFMFDLLWGDLWAIMTGRAWTVSCAGRQS